jgi:hypothetical protein
VDYTTATLVIGDNAKQYRMGATNSKNGTTTTAYSSAATLTVTRTTLGTPVAPTGSATTGSATSINVSLTGVANASSYTARIYLASDTSTVLQTLTSFTSGSAITGLTAATAYVVSITAIGDGISYADSSASALSSSITTNAAAATPTLSAPTSASKNVGQTHRFSSSATVSDAGALSYQWQVSTNGTDWSDISGATAVDYTTATLVIGDNAKQYRMGATNSKNGTTTTAYSSAATLTVTRTTLGTPVAPTGVATSNVSNSINVSLTGVANASSYTARIYLASDTSTVLQTLTSFTSGSAITGLTAATAYVVSITAIGDGISYADSSASALSSSITTNAAAATPTLSAPTSASKNVGATHRFSSSATVSDAGALSYQWQVSTNGTDWSNISGATAVDYTTATLVIGDNGKQYRMGATNSKNGTTTTAYSSAATLTVSLITLNTPLAPTGSATTGSATSINVSLTGVANATSYTARIYLASDTSTALQTLTSFTSGSAITGLTAATAYVVSITAIGNDIGYASSSASPLSASITTNKANLATPTAPTIAPTANTRKSLDVAWIAVSNAASYTLKLYNSSGSDLLATVSGLSGTTKVLTTSDYASIGESTGYRVTITADGDSQYNDSSESNKSSIGTTIPADAIAPVISSSPSNATKAATQTHIFSVTARSIDGGSLSYQWQISTDGGSTWANVTGGSGGTTSSYTTEAIAITANGHKYQVIVTNTYSGTTATATSSAATLSVNKANQSALSVASRDGVLGTPLTLVTSGGSSGGAVTFVVADGTATGCTISSGTLSVSTSGTCTVTATMAANATYNAVSSSGTVVTFTTTARSIGISVATTMTYQSSNVITVNVGTAGKVNFLQNGKVIPGCGEVRASVTSPATCTWRPSTLGSVSVVAEITPTNTSLALSRSIPVAVKIVGR